MKCKENNYLKQNLYSPFYVFIVLLAISCSTTKQGEIVSSKQSFSGIYPHLAHYNNHGECGTGAIVPWGDRLWVITYGQHFPNGSSDKLYEIKTDLTRIIRDESIGGTPANRMIHKESNQLFIGPYAIDGEGNIRAIPYEIMPGRHTGNARHLSNPEEMIYYGTMEEGFYEVDVNTLEVTELYPDANALRKKGELAQAGSLLPGSHGKGLYSGQSVMVYSNNGEATQEALHKFDVESGALLEWDGKNWKVVRRNQFTEVTGPGGIYGNENPETDQLWSIGWDHKSLILAVREHDKGWSFYRLPKASYSYDGAHGFNTEWPRIRNIGTETDKDYMMTMHGMFWRFPGTFSSHNTAGIMPRSSYLKVLGDFTRWHNKLVFGADDTAKREFLNKRKAKGNIKGPGQSNSNLWFADLDVPDNLGPTTAGGHLWMNEEVTQDEVSEAFLFNGWDYTCSWIKNNGNVDVVYTFEGDKAGDNNWSAFKTIKVEAGGSAYVTFDEDAEMEWVRVKVSASTNTSVSIVHTESDIRSTTPHSMFAGLTAIDQEVPRSKGLLYGLGDNKRALGVWATSSDSESAYYEVDGDLNFEPKEDRETAEFIQTKMSIPEQVVTIDKRSIKIVDDKERVWRLPVSTNTAFDKPAVDGSHRICREVVTERDLFNCHGTFYELPAENADGFAKIRPISSHSFSIHDYASYRGMLVLSGIDDREVKNDHIIRSTDGNVALWLGNIDDLWKLGKPTGTGGPWNKTTVQAGETSDPFLIGFYDKRSMTLSHQTNGDVEFVVEVDATGDGVWTQYKRFIVKPGEKFEHQFPDSFQARWIRFNVDVPSTVTAWFEYR